MELSRLPPRPISYICQHLPRAEAAAFARCCRAFRRIVQNTRACRCGFTDISTDHPLSIEMGPDTGGALAWAASGRVRIIITGDQQFLDFWPVLCAECRRRPGEFLRLYLRVDDCSCLTREHLALLGTVCHSLILSGCQDVTDVGMLGDVCNLMVNRSWGVSFSGLEALKNLKVIGAGCICSCSCSTTFVINATLRACAASGRR